MSLSLRTLLKSAPFAAISGLVFFLLPHSYDDKGRVPAVWPDWSWLDTVATCIVWIGTAALLASVDRRRRAQDKAILKAGSDGYELHVLILTAVKTTGVTWIFALVRWILPGSIWGSRAKGMPWFSWDSVEYQFLVMMWALGFLFIGYEDIADIPGASNDDHDIGAMVEPGPAAPSWYQDPDWVALRHVLLEARVGRNVEIPEHLRSHPVAQHIDRYFVSGDTALLDQAAAVLTENAADPWKTLTQGKQ